MARAASAWLGQLDQRQRREAQLEWTNRLRESWHYVPRSRPGRITFAPVRPAYFTTSLPPMIAAAALASVRHVRQMPCGGRTSRTAPLKRRLARRDFRCCRRQPYRALHIGDAALCSSVSRRLLDEFGMYATPINYPTVPRGEEPVFALPRRHAHRRDDDRLVAALTAILLPERRAAA